MTPRERFVELNRLQHHVIEWGEGDEVVVLCHGFLDFGFSFVRVAERLAAAGFRVVAFDFRGHGETEWIGRGGYYHFPDYTLDLEALVRSLDVDRVHLVGHSMGGTVASMYAGIRPERIRSLVLCEGMGPMPTDPASIPARFATWMDGVDRVRRRERRPMATLAEAAERLRTSHPELDDELALFLAEKGTRAVEGGYVFRFDPLHQTTAPVPFRLEVYTTFLGRIAAETLLLVGSRGYRLPDEDARLAHVPRAEKRVIEDVGHMVHWFRAAEMAEAIAGWAARADR
ncbi:MAG: alpha/beta hydrolase [Polyangiales bacterium]